MSIPKPDDLRAQHLHAAAQSLVSTSTALAASFELRSLQATRLRKAVDSKYTIPSSHTCGTCCLPLNESNTSTKLVIITKHRTKGGLNKRQRQRRDAKLKNKNAKGSLAKPVKRNRRQCLRCGSVTLLKIEKPKVKAESSQENITTATAASANVNASAKMRAKVRKNKSSLQKLVATKKVETKTSGLNLEDLMKL